MKCNFKKDNKEICKNNALQNEKFCYWHSKKIPEEEKNKQRSKGGKSKIIKVKSDFKEFELNTIADVCNLNTVLINSVLQNKIDLRVATGICYLLNMQLKGIELKSIESKIFKMEDIVIKLPPSFSQH